MSPVLVGFLPLLITLTALILWGFAIGVFGVVMALRVARGDYPEIEDEDEEDGETRWHTWK